MSAHANANKIMLSAIEQARRQGIMSSFLRVMEAHLCDGSIKLGMSRPDLFRELFATYEQVAKQTRAKPAMLKTNARMRIVCAEGRSPDCKIELVVSKPFDDITVWKAANVAGWIESVITEPGRGPDVPIDTALICEPCANLVLTPELVAAAKALMEKGPS